MGKGELRIKMLYIKMARRAQHLTRVANKRLTRISIRTLGKNIDFLLKSKA